MENLEVENVVKELCEGKELTKQLQTQLRHSSSSSSHQNLEFLLQRILYSYDHALSILAPPSHHPHRAAEVVPDSPRSLAGSPHTEDSDQDQALHPASRKSRKVGVARWSEKIKVGGDEELVGHELDDGYAWRKYGQKDILGAKYPRGYYRCTYRHAQGCLATKQVQRSDDDPTTFEITYRRNHTCNPRANTTSNPQLVELDPNPSSSTQNEPAAFNIQTSLRVITPDLAAANDINPSFHPFNFTSSSSINPQNNHTFPYGGTNILEDYNPMSTNIEYGGGLIPNLQNSESELSPIVASTTNSPTLGTHFPLGSSGPASDFSFGNSDFFP